MRSFGFPIEMRRGTIISGQQTEIDQMKGILNQLERQKRLFLGPKLT
jgi:hypothetical protein